MKDRKDIDIKYTWDLEKIFKSLDDFNSEYNSVNKLIDEVIKYENNMMESSDNFLSTIKLIYDIERRIDRLYSYVSLSFDLDTSDNDKQELVERVTNLNSKFSNNSYFVTPSILKCDKDVIDRYFEEKEELLEYKNAISNIYRYRDHVLSDAEEKLLSSINKAIGNNYDSYELLKDCDMTFDSIKDEDGKEVELNNSSYSLYIESNDRDVRKGAFVNLYAKYKQFSNTFASLISSHMKELSTFAKIAKFDSAIDASLFGDSVSIDVYNNLINSVHNKISYLYDYYKLKKDILGVDELHLYDVYVPITINYDKNYSYEEAKDIILDVLKVFGSEYLDKVKEGLASRWIDVYPTKNKRTGGYSGGCYDTNPYILLNYQDKYNDMSTLIHEMGHSIHSYYSREYNTYEDSSYRIFVAEVASTVNELLLSKYMLEHSDSKEEKLFILNNLMELYRATIYRQTMFAEFEKDISALVDNDEALTSSKLSNMYYDLNKFYFGSEVHIDDEIRYEWERIPHFYYDFYVYKYATGLSAATVIVNNILSGKENAVDNYISFLKCGSKKTPIESLKLAGVDLTDSKTVDNALDEFKKCIDMYKEIM